MCQSCGKHHADDPQPAKPGLPACQDHLARLQVAGAIRRERAASGQGATLSALATRYSAGYKVARALVPRLTRRGPLEVVGECQVLRGLVTA